MEASNQFQLELAIDGYLQQLQSKGNYTPDDILELKSHLQDNVDDLRHKQLNDEEAFIVAKKRLGKEEELHAEYKKVNGNIFYNRDLFVMVLSICFYLLFSFLYTIIQNVLQYFAVYHSTDVLILGITNYILQFVIVGAFIYLVFNSRRFLSRISSLFTKSPANFSSLLIILLVILYFIDLKFQRITTQNLSAEIVRERFYGFLIGNDISNFVKIALGSGVLIAFLAAFIKSYKKTNFLDSVINNAGYITLFCFGLFWDGLASSARMLHGFFNSAFLIPSFAFGLIWFIGMLIFNLYLKRETFYRNTIFISFGFVMEFVAGMWLNPGLRYGLPVSVFFAALIIGGSSGLLLARQIKRKRDLKIA